MKEMNNPIDRNKGWKIMKKLIANIINQTLKKKKTINQIKKHKINLRFNLKIFGTKIKNNL